MAITCQHQQAIETLHDRGARFVLLGRPDTPKAKRPARSGYLARKRPCLQAVTKHLNDGFNLGFVPWSLGLTGIDFDDGDRSQLMALPHRVALPTQSGGVHILFDDSRPRKNNSHQLHALSAVFDVRGSNGYLMFHGDGAERLADAMEPARRHRFRWTFSQRPVSNCRFTASRQSQGKRSGPDLVAPKRSRFIHLFAGLRGFRKTKLTGR